MLGSKAETLLNLRKVLKKSKICEILVFQVSDWLENKQEILTKIQTLSNDKVIIRSSALDEDTSNSSKAGYYDSFLNIESNNIRAIEESIENLMDQYKASLGDSFVDCQVLIQPMLGDVSLSGVIFTQDLTTGAPYYILNYDDSGSTESITSGSIKENKTIIIHRPSTSNVKSPRIKKIMEAVLEVEKTLGLNALDIEFAETNSGEVYLFQVRELSVQKNWNRALTLKIDKALNGILEFLNEKNEKYKLSEGGTGVWGQMPDWNPAEIIGTSPRPLALSLYEALITNRSWSKARAQMGYRDVCDSPLMASLYGVPYIDTRKSFESFIPAEVSVEVSSKLVNYWVEQLKENPENHDKVEFNVAATVFDPSFNQKHEYMRDLLGEGFDEYYKALLDMTNAILKDGVDSIERQLEAVGLLDKHLNDVLENERLNELQKVLVLIEKCTELGTIPFSICARHGFIAKSYLDSFVANGIMTTEDSQRFSSSVHTITNEFIEDVKSLRHEQITRDDFLSKYGHLRPGTYDILSLRYDQRELDFDEAPSRGDEPGHENFSFSDQQIKQIDSLLSQNGIDIQAKELELYLADAIRSREYTKFIFTKTLSAILELIAKWGNKLNLSRSELSFLSVFDIVKPLYRVNADELEGQIREISEKNRAQFEITSSLKLPHLILDPEDVLVFPMLRTKPNFVTSKKIVSETLLLSNRSNEKLDLEGKIILIESADPGFDWIFSFNIAGLITKFGGVNSHMAIRCAELEVPAAIGCGPQLFDRLKSVSKVNLNCKENLITVESL